MEIESQICTAVRDAVNKKNRKPFFWSGLAGYQQMEAIAQALTNLPQEEAETAYLQRIAMQVNRVVEKNRTLANDLQQAHDQLKRIADCLRYPSPPATERSPELVEGTNATPPATQQTSLTANSQAIAQEMQGLMAHFHPNKRQPAQSALSTAWHRTWHAYGPDLLHCYDIPALPPDNLQMEALFGRLRRHQRRISGRKSTCELALFGHCQVLFLADSQEDLLQQMQRVPLAAYQQQRRRLAEAEKPRQFLHRLHRQPLATMQALLAQHNQRRQQLALTDNTSEPHDDAPSQPLSLANALAQPANLTPNLPAFIRNSIFHSHPDNGLSDPLPP